MSHQNKPKKRDMEKTSINEQGGDVNHMTGIPLFTVRLFKRRIRDCPNLTSVFVVPSRFRELFF